MGGAAAKPELNEGMLTLVETNRYHFVEFH